MAELKLEQQKLLQVRNVKPESIRKFKIYALSHGMTNGEAFEKALQLLLSEKS